MTDTPREPSAEEVNQGAIAHVEIAELLNRLSREGISAGVLLGALSQTAADLVTCIDCIEKVPWWFYCQAKAAHDLLHGVA